jgi:uncharacterized protein (TIGR02996 family)
VGKKRERKRPPVQDSDFPELPEEKVRSFLATIRANFDDDAPRLVFADWLDDHGDPRGEMIRLSCELESLLAQSPDRPAMEARLADWGDYGKLLGKWIEPGLTHPEATRVGVERGLLRVHSGDEWECYNATYWPRFVRAVDQGWLGRAHVGGWRCRLDDLVAGHHPLLAQAPEIEIYPDRHGVWGESSL